MSAMPAPEASHRLLPWICFVALLTFAEVLLRVAHVPAYLIPTPSAILMEMVGSFPNLLRHLRITMIEALLGFVGGNCLAIVFGVGFSQVRFLREGMYPIVVGLQAVPVVAVAPFVLIWFGPGLVGKAIMAGLICYFPATVIATNGFSRVNRDALTFLRSLGATPQQVFWSLRLPGAIPSILSALEVSATLCTVGAVVAEMAGSSEGVGYLIVRASYEFRTATLFSALAVTSLFTFLLFKIVQLLGRHYGYRYSFSYTTAAD